jgi:polysaccharide biosynthesis transport protein
VNTPLDQMGAEGASTGSGISFFSVIWRRRALVFFGVVVGMLAGVLFYLQRAPTYQSQARIVVFQKRIDQLPTSNGPNSNAPALHMEQYVSTQEKILTSHIVWDPAASRLKREGQLKMPPPGDDYLFFIDSGLKVARDKDVNTGVTNNVLNIAFKGPSPEDAKRVVEAIIEGYKESLKHEGIGATDEQFNLVVAGLQACQTRLEEKRKEYKKLHDGIREKNTLMLSDLKMRVNTNEIERSTLFKEKINLETRMQLIREGIAANVDKDTLMRLFQMSGRKELLPDNPRSVEDITFALMLQEKELLERVGEQHPDVVSLRTRIAFITDKLGKQIKTPDPIKDQNPLDVYVNVLKNDLKAVELKSERIKTELVEDRQAIYNLSEFQDREKEVKDAVDEFAKQVQEFENRKRLLELTRDAPLYDARVMTPAAVGGKVSPLLPSTLALASVFGLLLGVVLAYLAEMSDKSFRSVEEVRQRLGLTVIGQVPALTPYEPSVIEQNPVDPMLVVHHAPKSIQAEAYRGVRTSLYFSTRGKGHQVIQVTSPNPGDGKSTLAANLAASIAQSGRKVILIDADFRKPRVHKIFGLGKAEVGLASVIAGEAELESAIYSCEVPGLSILPCGPRPANPADLLTSALFSEILDEIKKDYDFVLIDTPPMLAVSDPSVVAPRVDGVILTIRLVKNSRPMAEQAKERLTILGANVLGVVVNGMDELRGAYGYGYGYSYGYNYAYAYGDEPESSTKLNKSR